MRSRAARYPARRARSPAGYRKAERPQGRSCRFLQRSGRACRLGTGSAARSQSRVETGVHAARIALEYLVAVFFAQSTELVDVALRIVVIVTGLRVDALDRPQH